MLPRSRGWTARGVNRDEFRSLASRDGEFGTHPRVAELTGVSEDGPRSVNLAQLALERSEAKAHLGGLLVGQRLDCALVDGPSGGQTEVGGGLGDVVGEHLSTRRDWSASAN